MSLSRQCIAGLMAFLTFTTVAATGLNAEQQAVHVLNRLAYGPKPGDVALIKTVGVDSYIQEQLHPESLPPPIEAERKIAALPLATKSTQELLASFYEVRKSAREDDAEKKRRREFMQQLTEESAQARLIRATSSPRQLEEVMVDFWFNHFNVSGVKGLDRALTLSYENEAIRPHVFGKFRELLGATAHHPAMLFYLDNWLSSAPARSSSKELTSKNKKKINGINENYARELMELHTLGVEGGYTQKDVTELARIFTGWTFDPKSLGFSGAGYQFHTGRHDWGEKTWLNHRVKAIGEKEGDWALDVLAAHPATARHISYKIAQYFVSDSPPAALVERLSKHFLKSQGDIRSLLDVLFQSPEFWGSSGQKYKTPFRYVVSAIRATDSNVANYHPLIGSLNQLGMPIYGCQTPDGYKNTEQAWLNPEALTRRIEFATALGTGVLPIHRVQAGNKLKRRKRTRNFLPAEIAEPERTKGHVDINRLVDTLGSSLSTHTREIVATTQFDMQPALVLGSPDFMRH